MGKYLKYLRPMTLNLPGEEEEEKKTGLPTIFYQFIGDLILENHTVRAERLSIMRINSDFWLLNYYSAPSFSFY